MFLQLKFCLKQSFYLTLMTLEKLCLLLLEFFLSRSKFRSSHPEVFLGKGVLKICRKFTGEHQCQSVILIKLLCNFIEIALRRGYSLVNLLHIFRIPFPRNTSEWLHFDVFLTLSECFRKTFSQYCILEFLTLDQRTFRALLNSLQLNVRVVFSEMFFKFLH